MLSRLLARTSNLLAVTRISSTKSLHHSPPISNPPLLFKPNSSFILQSFRCFSSDGGDNFGKDPPVPASWKLSPEQEDDSIFKDTGDLAGLPDENLGFGDKPTTEPLVGGSAVNVDSWGNEPSASGDIFANIEKEIETEAKKSGGGVDDWETAQGYKPWTFDEDVKTDVFDIGEGVEGFPDINNEIAEREKSEHHLKLEKEKSELYVQLKGPNRAFGDLIAASGITDAMLDSLIALKDLEALEGLPPLSEIEDIRLAKSEMKNTRAEIERQKQEEIAKSRVRRVDDKGRAYGTGRRKCSVARVFIQPGDGKFIINDKPFDVYFPILDHRADVLRPFSETKTLGLWDILCTVKGGGVSGQVGAVRLGISRALQNWEPGLRPSLRAAGFLTRDPRMVERKKPGKAKARKSFQWVKR